MAYYSDELLEEVLSQNDIVEIIGEQLQLKKKGRNYFGCCPFHKEKTASMSVSPDKQLFKCFGCGEGGNVLKFVMKSKNIDFRESLEYLAEKANIDVTKYLVGTSNIESVNSQTKDLKANIYKMNIIAARAFSDSLRETTDKILVDYLEKRNLSKESITKFGIGYGTCKQPLMNILKKEGFTEEDILASELIKKVEKNNKVWYFESFKDRLIFPIFDVRDRVIAFGGRTLKEVDTYNPKYVNSTENLVYHKGNTLYGMNVAKKEKLENIIVVEGYMDCLALQKSGITNAVASLGTALTESQAKLIKKYTEQVIMCYDQDAAGQNATLRAISILSTQGLKTKVLKLDSEKTKDPDDYINMYGVEKFKQCIKKAKSAAEYKIETLTASLDATTQDGKLKLLNEIVKVLVTVENDIEREMYIENLSKEYNISIAAITNEINKKIRPMQVTKKTENAEEFQMPSVLKRTLDTQKRIEQYLIALLLSKDRKIFERIAKNILPEDINNSIIRELYVSILSLINKDNIKTIDIMSKIENKEQVNELASILMLDIELCNRDKLLEDVEKKLILARHIKLRQYVIDRLEREDVSNDEKEILNIELLHILREINKIKR
ncbi:MAG: DNA primase [Clostridia bacterium]